MLTVREILQLDALRQVEVVAGTPGLGRQVRWCHIIDIPEIIPWVRGGELLLTTGYGWPKTDSERRGTVRALNGKGLAAMLFAPSRFLGRIPPSVLKEADALHLPVLEAPWELAFSEITEAVSREIIRRHYDAIERADRYHRLLTRAAIEARDLNDIASTLCSLIGRSVAIEDPGLRLLGHAECEDAHDAAREDTLRCQGASKTIRHHLETHHLLERLRLADGAIRVPAIPEIGMSERVACSIRAGTELLGYLWILEGNEPLSDLDCRVAEHGATVAALHIFRQRSQAAVEARIGYTVVDALIRGDVPEEDLVERARLLGFDPDSSYVVAIVSLVDSTKRGRRWVLSDRHDYYRRERAGQVARHLLEQERLPVLCTYSLNQIVCLLPANPRAGEQEWLRRVAGALYQQLAAADDVPPVILTLGKAHAGLAGVMRSHWESDRALSLASGDEGVLFFEDLTLANLLAQVSERDSLEAMYARTLGPLLMSAKGRVLKETLWALVAAGFNQEEAAAAMGIHRNTMRGRLLRVQDILARPLTDPTLRRDLGVVKEIERLLGSQVAARLS